MNEQTRIEPCAFCDEPSVGELELIPEVLESQDGAMVQVKRPVKRAVCAQHAQAIRGGSGWQERMKDNSRRLTTEAKQRLGRDQGKLW